MNDETDGRTIRADDPRLSEWLDGRLPAAEAAEVARSVAASPELTRVVADLRRVKALLAAAPALPAPAGFVADVLAALDAPPRLAAGTAARAAGGPADPRVDAEWERIELERLAGEIAEAREDAAAAETTAQPRQRWPWMTMLGALAAGLLVAALVNMPPLHSVLVEHDRDVALRGAGQPQEGLSRAVNEFFADTAADGVTEAAKETETAELVKRADETKDRALDARLAHGAADQPNQAGPKADPTGSAKGTAPGGGGGGIGGGLVDLESVDRARSDRPESGGSAPAAAEPVVVVVRGPEGRAEFTAQLAARNISVTRRPVERKSELPPGKAATKPGAPPGNADGNGVPTEGGRRAGYGDDLDRDRHANADKAAAAPVAAASMAGAEEVIAISGSREAIDQLLASLDTRRATLKAAPMRRGAEASRDTLAARDAASKRIEPTAEGATAAEPPVTLLVRLVDVGVATAATGPADAAAGPSAAKAVDPAATPAAPAAGQSQGAGDQSQGAGDRREP